MAAVIIPEEVRSFLNSIIDLSLEQELGQEDREVLLMRLYEELDEYMMGAAIDALPEDKLDAYEKMVVGDTDREGMLNFFRENVPNLQQVIDRAVLEFKQLYVDAAEGGTTESE